MSEEHTAGKKGLFLISSVLPLQVPLVCTASPLPNSPSTSKQQYLAANSLLWHLVSPNSLVKGWLFPSAQLLQCMAVSSIQQTTDSLRVSQPWPLPSTWFLKWTEACRTPQWTVLPSTKYQGEFLASSRGHISSKFCWHGITELLLSSEPQLCLLQQSWVLISKRCKFFSGEALGLVIVH